MNSLRLSLDDTSFFASVVSVDVAHVVVDDDDAAPVGGVGVMTSEEALVAVGLHTID